MFSNHQNDASSKLNMHCVLISLHSARFKRDERWFILFTYTAIRLYHRLSFISRGRWIQLVVALQNRSSGIAPEILLISGI